MNRQRRLAGRAVRRRRRLRRWSDQLGYRLDEWQVLIMDQLIYGSRNV